MEIKKHISTWSLMLGMFFLPFGYDALFKIIMDWTGSYWAADLIFYAISFIFFFIYWYIEGTFGRLWKHIKSAFLFVLNWLRSKSR